MLLKMKVHRSFVSTAEFNVCQIRLVVAAAQDVFDRRDVQIVKGRSLTEAEITKKHKKYKEKNQKKLLEDSRTKSVPLSFNSSLPVQWVHTLNGNFTTKNKALVKTVQRSEIIQWWA